MIEDPKIVTTEAQHTATIRLRVPREEMRTVMGPGIGELMSVIAAQGLVPSGPWFNQHLRLEPHVFDFEIGIPVPTPVSPTGRVQPGILPATTVARTVYHGPYEGLSDAWKDLMAWIETSGHTPAENLWECYTSGPESSPDPSTWRTELNRPLLP